MEYYLDHLNRRERRPEHFPLGAHYHTWTPESIQQIWRVWSNNPVLRNQFYPRRLFEEYFARMHQELASVARVVDIGCGTGTVLELLEDRQIGRSWTGIDLSDESLGALRRKYDGDARFSFKVGSISQVPLADDSCDLVVCTETFEHLSPEDLDRGLTEIARVLAPGGYLTATVPFDEQPNFVVCPECYAIFTPFQHMMFSIDVEWLRQQLSKRGLVVAKIIDPVDPGVPRQAWKRIFKDRVLTPFFPKLTQRLFKGHGVSGILARKQTAAGATAR